MAAMMGTGKARRASVNSAFRSLMVAERRLRASRISPERQSRSTHKTSWPTSGCRPSMANTARRCLHRRACSRARFVVAVQEVADRAQGNGDATTRQLLVDLGDAAMLGVTEASDQGEDVEAELVVGQSDEGLRSRAAGTAVTRAVGVGAAANAQGEACDRVEGGDGAIFGVGGPEGMTTLRAARSDRGESLGLCRARPATSACHGSPSFPTPLLFYRAPPPKFASLVFLRARCCSTALAAILWARARILNSLAPKRWASSVVARWAASSPISASTASWMARERSSISACFSGDSGAGGMRGLQFPGSDSPQRAPISPLCTKIPPTFKTPTGGSMSHWQPLRIW